MTPTREQLEEEILKAAEDYAQVKFEGLNKNGERMYSATHPGYLSTRFDKIDAFIAGVKYSMQTINKDPLAKQREADLKVIQATLQFRKRLTKATAIAMLSFEFDAIQDMTNCLAERDQVYKGDEK